MCAPLECRVLLDKALAVNWLPAVDQPRFIECLLNISIIARSLVDACLEDKYPVPMAERKKYRIQ